MIKSPLPKVPTPILTSPPPPLRDRVFLVKEWEGSDQAKEASAAAKRGEAEPNDAGYAEGALEHGFDAWLEHTFLPTAQEAVRARVKASRLSISVTALRAVSKMGSAEALSAQPPGGSA